MAFPAPAKPGADKVHAGFAGWEEADLMAMHTPDDERQWAAEKRDFVADRRDQLAAEREAAGDTRDVTADARESALDERERQLDARAAELGLPGRAAKAAAQLVDAGADGSRRGRRVRSFGPSAMLPHMLVIRRRPGGWKPTRPHDWRRRSPR